MLRALEVLQQQTSLNWPVSVKKSDLLRALQQFLQIKKLDDEIAECVLKEQEKSQTSKTRR